MSASVSAARARTLSQLNDSSLVSEAQREVVLSSGNFFALACPGSGKTRTVGFRLAWRNVDDPTSRIAVTSYTNIAVSEVRTAADRIGTVLGEQHFVGTLHSFLLRYVVYPFGHLVMSCSEVPRIVAAESQSAAAVDDVVIVAASTGIPIWNFSYGVDGAFSVDLPFQLERAGVTQEMALAIGTPIAVVRKEQTFKRGLLSYSDAMYVAMRVLELHPELAQNLAARFDEIVIDEAQDTTDIQFRCLDLIKRAGLCSIVLVGDVDQSIYGWTGASPEQVLKFAQAHDLVEIPLVENFRSSQRICDVTWAFSSRNSADKAQGPNRDANIAPELLLYDASNVESARSAFNERLAALSVDAQGGVVLVRTSAFADRLNGKSSARSNWTVRSIAEAVTRFRATGTLDRQSMRNLEAVLAELAWGTGALQERTAESRLLLRRQAVSVLNRIPEPSGTLRDWIAAIRGVVVAALSDLSTSPAVKPSNRIRSQQGDDKRDAATAFRAERTTLPARTIHSAKGESHEAVLLVAQAPTGERDHAKEWIKHRLGSARDEETRVAYVGLTRARNYVAVALPVTTDSAVVEAYVGAGMQLVNGPNG